MGPHAHHPLLHLRVFEQLKQRNVFRMAVKVEPPVRKNLRANPPDVVVGRASARRHLNASY